MAPRGARRKRNGNGRKNEGHDPPKATGKQMSTSSTSPVSNVGETPHMPDSSKLRPPPIDLSRYIPDGTTPSSFPAEFWFCMSMAYAKSPHTENRLDTGSQQSSHRQGRTTTRPPQTVQNEKRTYEWPELVQEPADDAKVLDDIWSDEEDADETDDDIRAFSLSAAETAFGILPQFAFGDDSQYESAALFLYKIKRLQEKHSIPDEVLLGQLLGPKFTGPASEWFQDKRFKDFEHFQARFTEICAYYESMEDIAKKFKRKQRDNEHIMSYVIFKRALGWALGLTEYEIACYIRRGVHKEITNFLPRNVIPRLKKLELWLYQASGMALRKELQLVKEKREAGEIKFVEPIMSDLAVVNQLHSRGNGRLTGPALTGCVPVNVPKEEAGEPNPLLKTLNKLSCIDWKREVAECSKQQGIPAFIVDELASEAK